MKTTKLYVEVYDTITHSESSDEPYGDWYETNEFYPTGVHLKGDRLQKEDFEIKGDIKKGDEVYVLWLTYTTGDSFGHSEGNGEILWVFTDLDTANRAKEVWKSTSKERKYNDESKTFQIEDGTTVKLSNPAAGYFESLESLEITTFTVE